MKSAIILILLLLSQGLFALDYDTMLDSVLNNSSDVDNIELQYKNGLINNSKNDLEDEMAISAGTGTISLLPSDNPLQNDININDSFVSVTLPNDGKTTIQAQLSTGIHYEDNSIYTVRPSIGASHTFDLNPIEETTLEDLAQSKTSLLNERTYQVSLINLEKQLLNKLRNIITVEKNVITVERTIKTTEDAIEQSLETEYYAKDSLRHKNDVNKLNIYKNQLEYLNKQFTLAKEEFKEATLLDYEFPTELKEYDLTFKPLDEGNSDVILSLLDLDMANLKISNLDKINKNVIVNGALAPTSISKNNSLNLNLGAQMQYDRWKFNASFNGNYDNAKLTPTLTVGATWSNDNQLVSQALDRESLNNEKLMAEIAYQDAKMNYLDQVDTLNLNIYNFNNTLIEANTNTEYLKNTVEYEKELFDNGFKTDDDYNNAVFNLEMNKYEEILITIDGILLELDIKNLMI